MYHILCIELLCVVRVGSDFLIKALVLFEIRFKKAYSFLYDEELPAERQVCHMVFIAKCSTILLTTSTSLYGSQTMCCPVSKVKISGFNMN